MRKALHMFSQSTETTFMGTYASQFVSFMPEAVTLNR